jgi:hypothetical protein
MRLRLPLLFIALTIFLCPLQASILAGHNITVTVEYYEPGMIYGSYYSGLVPGTPTVSIPIYSSSGPSDVWFNLDVSDSSIVATSFTRSGQWAGPSNWSGITFNGWVLKVDDGSPIAGITVDPSTNMIGFRDTVNTPGDNVTFTPNQVRVNWMGLGFDGQTRVQLNLQGYTPEPGTWALLAGGLALVVAARRRRA